MLKRPIKYEDFEGNEVSEDFYFNLTKTELIELEVKYPGGMQNFLERIINTRDAKEIIAQFKEIILMAYGVKSEDGKRFIKNDTIREEFTQTPAYDVLFMELSQDADAAAIFLKGIMPSDLTQELDKAIAEEAAKAQKQILGVEPSPHSA